MESNSYVKAAVYGLAAVGALVGMKSLGKLASFARYFLARSVPLQKTYGEKTWAVITGGNKGIGLEFARQLGAKGFNIFIVDKSMQEGKKAAAYLNKLLEKSSVKVITGDVANFAELHKTFADYDVSILVNNAGIAVPGMFLSNPVTSHSDLICTNCLGTAGVTHGILQSMVKRKGKSLIVFMGSFLGEIPSSYNATYAASKAFLQSFSQSLRHEVPSSIDVSLLHPLYVKTRLSSFLPRNHFMLVSPDEFVASAIKDIEKGYFVTHGHWKHKIIAKIVCSSKLLKERMQEWVTEQNKQAEKRMNQYNLLIKNRNNKQFTTK